MKRNLLFLLLICLFTFSLHGQNNEPCDGCEKNTIQNDQVAPQVVAKKNDRKKIAVYPNPATNFIGLTEPEGIKEIMVFNIIGRKMKNFKVNADEKYNVADLPKGVYLIRLIDDNNKVVTTQRLNKG